jgi:hypothetical protein
VSIADVASDLSRLEMGQKENRLEQPNGFQLRQNSNTAGNCPRKPRENSIDFGISRDSQRGRLRSGEFSKSRRLISHQNRSPAFRVRTINRTIEAVNYQHRGRSTKLDFAGTDLMSSAGGEAKIDSKRGSIAIEAEFSNLDGRPASVASI